MLETRSNSKTGILNAQAIRFAILCVLAAMSFGSGCTAKKDGSQTQPLSSSKVTQQESLQSIHRAMQETDLQLALERAEQHVLNFPEDPDGLVMAAQATHGVGDVSAAVALLDDAVKIYRRDGNGAEAEKQQIQAAMLLAQSQRFGDAIARLKTILQQSRDADIARHALAQLLNSRGYRFEANELVRELCGRSGATAAELRGLISPTRAFATFSKKPDPNNPTEIRKLGALSAARALFGEGDVLDAIKVLRESDEVAQKEPQAIAFLGQVLIESQQFAEFQKWLANVPADCKRFPAYWMAMGGWALHQNQAKAAVRLFAEAVLREPGDPAANLRFAQATSAVGEKKVATRMEQRNASINLMTQTVAAILRDPDLPPEAYVDLSGALMQAGRPLEALAWRQLLMMRMRAPDSDLEKLHEQRLQWASPDQESQSKLQRALLCGLDLKKYPLPIDGVLDTISTTSLSPTDRKVTPPLEPVFVNQAKALGLDFAFRNAVKPVDKEFRIFEAYGAGLACLDFDLDGNIDLYVGQAAADPPSRGLMPNLLARNQIGKFVDVTVRSATDDRGYATGVTSGDWNQDGFPDLIIGNLFENKLFINQGDGSFRGHEGNQQWQEALYTTALAIADVTGDHLPDIVEINYLDDPSILDPIEYKPDGTPIRLPGPLHFRPAADRVFVSTGDGSMVAQTLGDNNGSAPATGLGLVVTNIDGKPGNEIFVANDLMANHLWFAVQKGQRAAWIDRAGILGAAHGSGGSPMACMGIGVADFDNNGRVDFHITNFEDQWSNHYLQDDRGQFVDLALPCGFGESTRSMLGFGVQALDYDNNGTQDLVVGNGHIEDHTAKGSAFEMPTQLFVAVDGSRYEVVQPKGDADYWSGKHLTRGLAKADLNSDGLVDFVATDLKKPLVAMMNQTKSDYHWLQFVLVGTRSERDAIGATVSLKRDGFVSTHWVQTGDGYMAKNSGTVYIGLGSQGGVQSVLIDWPSGRSQELSVEVDKSWLVIEDQEPFWLRGAIGP